MTPDDEGKRTQVAEDRGAATSGDRQ